MSRRGKIAFRFITGILALAAAFGLFTVVDNYLVKDEPTVSATADDPHAVAVFLNEGDTVERTVTERNIQFRRQYSVNYDGKLVKFGIPTPYIGTNTVGDVNEATVYNLCDALSVINAESRSDHPERDTKELNDACAAAQTAQTNGKIDDCEDNLLHAGDLISARFPSLKPLDYSFTNGNLNSACGDTKGRSAALASGTYDTPVVPVGTGK